MNLFKGKGCRDGGCFFLSTSYHLMDEGWTMNDGGPDLFLVYPHGHHLVFLFPRTVWPALIRRVPWFLFDPRFDCDWAGGVRWFSFFFFSVLWFLSGYVLYVIPYGVERLHISLSLLFRIFVKTIMFYRTSTRKPVTSSVWLYSANREESHWREMKLARKVCTLFQSPIPPPISPIFQFPTLPPPRPRFTPGLLDSLRSWITTDFIFF